jgi:hypothetical protein
MENGAVHSLPADAIGVKGGQWGQGTSRAQKNCMATCGHRG